VSHTDTIYEDFIHTSRYARWLPDKGRRESWDETVLRYINFWQGRDLLEVEDAKELYQAILNKEVMPSMRCMMTAGPALEKENVAGYNCAFVAIDNQVAFDEILYILMNGTGVGFSVENECVKQLPTVADDFFPTDTTIVVADSKLGWAKAFRELIGMLYLGRIPRWDMSKVRPAGERLKTFGGRASGPEPLDELFRFAVNTFQGAAGRKLTSTECHDLVCKTAEVVVVGGVRRSALISLSDLGDPDLSTAKSGSWWHAHPERALANNSAVYDGTPSVGAFLREWTALYESKSGERGIFNRKAATDLMPERRDAGNYWIGTNP
jgi:ribonucleoside-triphosphate reductase